MEIYSTGGHLFILHVGQLNTFVYVNTKSSCMHFLQQKAVCAKAILKQYRFKKKQNQTIGSPLHYRGMWDICIYIDMILCFLTLCLITFSILYPPFCLAHVTWLWNALMCNMERCPHIYNSLFIDTRLYMSILSYLVS